MWDKIILAYSSKNQCKKIEEKVGSLFSAKRLKKKMGQYLVQKD